MLVLYNFKGALIGEGRLIQILIFRGGVYWEGVFIRSFKISF